MTWRTIGVGAPNPESHSVDMLWFSGGRGRSGGLATSLVNQRRIWRTGPANADFLREGRRELAHLYRPKQRRSPRVGEAA